MNLYKVDIEIISKVSVQVQASDENAAKQQARKIALEGFTSNSQVNKSEAHLVREAPFEIGAKVKHTIFGIGTIESLSPSSSGAGQKGWSASVKFEGEHGTKGIVIMPGKNHLEPVDA